MPTKRTHTPGPHRNAVKIGVVLVLSLTAVALGFRNFLFGGSLPEADPQAAAMNEQVVAAMSDKRPPPPAPTEAERSVEPGSGKSAQPVPRKESK